MIETSSQLRICERCGSPFAPVLKTDAVCQDCLWKEMYESLHDKKNQKDDAWLAGEFRKLMNVDFAPATAIELNEYLIDYLRERISKYPKQWALFALPKL